MQLVILDESKFCVSEYQGYTANKQTNKATSQPKGLTPVILVPREADTGGEPESRSSRMQ